MRCIAVPRSHPPIYEWQADNSTNCTSVGVKIDVPADQLPSRDVRSYYWEAIPLALPIGGLVLLKGGSSTVRLYTELHKTIEVITCIRDISYSGLPTATHRVLSVPLDPKVVPSSCYTDRSIQNAPRRLMRGTWNDPPGAFFRRRAQTRVDCLVRCTASSVQNLRSLGQSNAGEGTRSSRCALARRKIRGTVRRFTFRQRLIADAEKGKCVCTILHGY